jgi:MoaA/NifB/PqqE/SkfB family radical SAM enzyme
VESYRDNSLIHSKSSVEDFGREVCGTCAYGLNIRHDGEIMLDMHFARNISLGNIRNMAYQQAIQRQQKAIRELFQSFSGYCPARDVRAQSFLDNHLLINGYT